MIWQEQLARKRSSDIYRGSASSFCRCRKSISGYYGFHSTDDIYGKTDEDIGWHTDNAPFKDMEEDVLKEGKVIRDEPELCIIKGVLHHIRTTKFPIYDHGEIVGLTGYFIDCSMQEKTANNDLLDHVVQLMNSRGLMDSLLEFSARNDMGNYGCIIF